jgi:hypothetical protein
MRPTLDSLKQSLKASSLVLLGLTALGCEGGAFEQERLQFATTVGFHETGHAGSLGVD